MKNYFRKKKKYCHGFMPSNFQVISGSRVSENSWLLASTETPVILQTQTHTYTHTHTHTHTQHTLGPVD